MRQFSRLKQLVLLLFQSIIGFFLLSLPNEVHSWKLSKYSHVVFSGATTVNKTKDYHFNTTSFKTFYVLVEGHASAKITYDNPKTGKKENITCQSPNRLICPLWNYNNGENGPQHSVGNGPYFYGPNQIKVNFFMNTNHTKKGGVIKFIGSDFVEIGCQDHLIITMDNKINNLDIRVNMEDVPTYAKEVIKDMKIQFFAIQGSQYWMNFKEEFNMYIKAGSQFAAATDHHHKASSSLGFGVVNTILPRDDEFCITTECFYAVRIETKNVIDFRFNVEIFNRVMKEYIGAHIIFLDEIREDDFAVYNMIPFDKRESDWTFRMKPAVGDPDMYIQGDKLPAKLEDFSFHTAMDSSEDIVITNKEAKKRKYSNLQYYVKVVAKDNKKASYLTIIERSLPGTPIRMIPNIPITGEADTDEIINYVFRLYTQIPETLEAFIQLTTLSGNPDIYIKECSDSFNLCKVTKKDVKNKDTLAADKTKFFRYSDKVIGNDKIHIQVNCAKIVLFGGDESNHVFHNNYFTSKTCQFAIAVRGGNTIFDSISRYSLVFKGFKNHNILGLGFQAMFKLAPNQKSMYVYHHNATATPNAEGIQFEVDVLGGDCEVFFSRTEPFPSSKNVDDESMMLSFDNDEDELSSRMKYLKFTKDNTGSLSGVYYIGIYSSELVYGQITVKLIEKAPIKPFKQLFLGYPQISRTEGITPADLSDYYYFKVNLQNQTADIENSEVVEIIISINAFKGRFNLCVGIGEKKIEDKFSECIWTSDGEAIHLSSYDPLFEANQTYSILVQEESTSNSTLKIKGFYQIEVTSKMSSVYLMEGRGHRTAGLPSTDYYFQMMVPLNTTDLLIFVDGDNHAQFSLRATLNQTDYQVESLTGEVKVQMNENPAIFFDKKDIAVYCDPELYKDDPESPSPSGSNRRALQEPDEMNGVDEVDGEQMIDFVDDIIEPCTMYIKVSFNHLLMTDQPTDMKKKTTQFYVTANTGKNPFYLNEGVMKSLPAPYESPIKAIVLFDKSDLVTNGITFNTYSRLYNVETIVTGHFWKEQKEGENEGDDREGANLRLKKKKWISSERQNNIIHINKKEFGEFKIAVFYLEIRNLNYERKNHAEEKDYRDYDLQRRIFVQASTNVLELRDGIKAQDLITKGSFKYFKVIKVRCESLLVVLDVVNTGEADLYIQENGKYPTLTNYLAKSTSYKNDMIYLESEESKFEDKKEWEKVKNEETTLIVGVYGEMNTLFQIMQRRNTPQNVVQASSGIVYEKTIQAGGSLILQYYNLEGISFDLGFYSEDTLLTVYAKPYNEIKEHDFLKAIPEETEEYKVGHSRSSGIVERAKLSPMLGSGTFIWLIKIVPQTKTTISKITVFVQNEDEVIDLTENQMLTDRLPAGSTQTYHFFVKKHIRVGKVLISLQHGSVKILAHPFKIPSEKDTTLKAYLSSDGGNSPSKVIKLQKPKSSSGLGLFTDFFFSVEAASASVFKIKILPAQNKFKELVPGMKNEYIYNNRKRKKLYYRIHSTENIQSFKVMFHVNRGADILMTRHMRKDGEKFTKLDVLSSFKFYIVPDSAHTLKGNLKDIKIPLDVTNTAVLHYANRDTFIYQFAIRKGVFVIEPKFEKNTQFRFKTSIELVINNVRKLSANGWLEDTIIDKKEDQIYEIVVPNSGYLEVNIEKCQGSLLVGESTTLQQKFGELVPLGDKKGFDKTFKTAFYEAGSYFLKIKDTKMGQPSDYVIRTRFNGESSELWPESFFFNDPYNPEFNDFKVEPVSKHVFITANKIVGAEGLLTRYPNIKRAVVKYTLYVVQSKHQLFKYKTCDPAIAFNNSKIKYQSEGFQYPVVLNGNGQLEWETSGPKTIRMGAKIPKNVKAPFQVMVLVQIALKGSYEEELGDDIFIRGMGWKTVKKVEEKRRLFFIFSSFSAFFIIIFCGWKYMSKPNQFRDPVTGRVQVSGDPSPSLEMSDMQTTNNDTTNNEEDEDEIDEEVYGIE